MSVGGDWQWTVTQSHRCVNECSANHNSALASTAKSARLTRVCRFVILASPSDSTQAQVWLLGCSLNFNAHASVTQAQIAGPPQFKIMKIPPLSDRFA